MEYEGITTSTTWEYDEPEEWKLKINSDGTVIIHPIQERKWTDEQVIRMLEIYGGTRKSWAREWFNKNTYKVSGGLHGVGVSCVNALSTKLHVTVQREGKIFEQEYSIGVPKYAVREIGTSDITGTKVHFWPDTSIFQETVYRKEILEGRLRELAYLNRKINITLTDLRVLSCFPGAL